MKALVIAVVLAACGDNEPPVAPLVDLHSMDHAPEYMDGLRAWSSLGFEAGANGDECDRFWYDEEWPRGRQCTITIEITREDGLYEALAVDGYADRDHRLIDIDARYTGRRLVHLAAHEIGHILLDTGHLPAGEVGVMAFGQLQTEISAADRELACESIGICVP